MKKRLKYLIPLGLLILPAFLFVMLFVRAKPFVPGVRVSPIASCQLEFYDRTVQPMYTIALSCPGIDTIRLWPFPIIKPWFEDWFENPVTPGQEKKPITFLQLRFRYVIS